MVKKDNINLKWWIISVAIISLIILLAFNVLSITYIDAGNCIVLANGTNICASKVICSVVKQNVSLTCQPSDCRYNISCPNPVITNKINNTVVNIEQPIVSRDFLRNNQIPILVIVAGIAILIAWRTGLLNKIKLPIRQEQYYDNVQRYPQRDLRETGPDFNELK